MREGGTQVSEKHAITLGVTRAGWGYTEPKITKLTPRPKLMNLTKREANITAVAITITTAMVDLVVIFI